MEQQPVSLSSDYQVSLPKGSSSMSGNSSQQSAVAEHVTSLMILSPEIRDMIWKELVTQEAPICPFAAEIAERLSTQEPFMERPSERNVLAIARSCKQIHEEVMSIYFKHNTFRFYHTGDLRDFLSHIRPASLLHLRTLSFTYRGEFRREAFTYLRQCVNLRRLEIILCLATRGYNRMLRTRDLQGAQALSTLRELRVVDTTGFVLNVRSAERASDEFRLDVNHTDHEYSMLWGWILPDCDVKWLRDILFGEITGAVKGSLELKADKKAQREQVKTAKRKLAAEKKAEKAKVGEIKRQLAADKKIAKGKKNVGIGKGAASGKMTPK